MSNKHDAFEKAFEVFLNEAAENANHIIGTELGQNVEEHVFSKEHEITMQKLFRAERRSIRLQKAAKHAKRAACFVVALLVALAVTISSVDAWRIRFLNFVLEIGEPNTDFNFGQTGSTRYTDRDVTLFYVPEGFQLVQKQVARNVLHLSFDNGKQYFQFDLQPVDVNSSIDTENGTAEEITINGKRAIYTTNPNINAVLWYDEVHSYRILGTVEKKEMIKIAENLVAHYNNAQE